MHACPIYHRNVLTDEDRTFPGIGANHAAFDFVVGNPPWIAWDHLPAHDRNSTLEMWRRYGLFSLSGNEARHGGAKKDLSMLITYVAADRHLKPRGRLGFVITQTVFQTKGAGDGFRRFRLGATGAELKVVSADDLVAARPFPGAANWTGVLVLEKGIGHRISNSVCKMAAPRGAAVTH